MKNVDVLSKRVDSLENAVDPVPHPLQGDLAALVLPDLHLFSAEEQAAARHLITEMAAHVDFFPDGKINLHGLTNEELDQLGRFMMLDEALLNGDQAQASKCRLWLYWGREELIERFLALNLDDKEYQYTARAFREGWYSTKYKNLDDLRKWF